MCDLSLEMLKIGKRRIEIKLNDLSNIKFLRADVLDMPFIDKSVQTVMSFGMFHIFENPALFIREMIRITEPAESCS